MALCVLSIKLRWFSALEAGPATLATCHQSGTNIMLRLHARSYSPSAVALEYHRVWPATWPIHSGSPPSNSPPQLRKTASSRLPCLSPSSPTRQGILLSSSVARATTACASRPPNAKWACVPRSPWAPRLHERRICRPGCRSPGKNPTACTEYLHGAFPSTQTMFLRYDVAGRSPWALRTRRRLCLRTCTRAVVVEPWLPCRSPPHRAHGPPAAASTAHQ